MGKPLTRRLHNRQRRQLRLERRDYTVCPEDARCAKLPELRLTTQNVVIVLGKPMGFIANVLQQAQ